MANSNNELGKWARFQQEFDSKHNVADISNPVPSAEADNNMTGKDISDMLFACFDPGDSNANLTPAD